MEANLGERMERYLMSRMRGRETEEDDSAFSEVARQYYMGQNRRIFETLHERYGDWEDSPSPNAGPAFMEVEERTYPDPNPSEEHFDYTVPYVCSHVPGGVELVTARGMIRVFARDEDEGREKLYLRLQSFFGVGVGV